MERDTQQQSFYYSKKWQRTRAAFMTSKHYICERCGAPAKICHHKEYVTPGNLHDLSVVLDWSNLECLCMDCHNKEHFFKPATSEGLTFDSNGDVIHVGTLKN